MDIMTKYLRYFGLFTVGVFIILGIVLLVTDYFDNIPFNYRIIFSILLISYGVFRFISILVKPKSYENEDDN